MLRTETLRFGQSDEWLESQAGLYCDISHFDRVIKGQACDLDKPNGSPLLRYRPRAIARPACDQARAALRSAGSAFNTHRRINSGTIGYNRTSHGAHAGECRATRFTGSQWEKWGDCLPFIRACDAVFQRELPGRHATQLEAVRQIDPAYRIGHTAFTTGAVNRWDASHDGRTPLHIDKQDLRQGFGVISCLTLGDYEGGELIFPKWGVAVSMRTGDVLLADVHEWHANNAIVGQPGWERIAVILYAKEAMLDCSAVH